MLTILDVSKKYMTNPDISGKIPVYSVNILEIFQTFPDFSRKFWKKSGFFPEMSVSFGKLRIVYGIFEILTRRSKFRALPCTRYIHSVFAESSMFGEANRLSSLERLRGLRAKMKLER